MLVEAECERADNLQHNRQVEHRMLLGVNQESWIPLPDLAAADTSPRRSAVLRKNGQPFRKKCNAIHEYW
jgi:hypothetical protein